jgi:hypothetical protein
MVGGFYTEPLKQELNNVILLKTAAKNGINPLLQKKTPPVKRFVLALIII